MKKFVALLLAAMMVLSVVAVASAEDMRVAMITDYGDITDQSFNQTTYEAAKAWCEANGVDFTYYKPAGDSTAERVAMVEKADDEGYNVLIMPGYAFGGTIAEVQGDYPEVKFVALDVSAGDLGEGVEVGSNVYCAVYQEELCGYMAGYAAVKLGYKHLGFLGGMAVPAVVRYGFGFVQGANDAAAELGIAGDVTVEYVYGNQFYGDADITAYMDNWYQTLGVEVVFACGGGIFTSAGEAAAKVPGAKVIGVDVDQAATIDGLYGEGLTVTSASTKAAASTRANATMASGKKRIRAATRQAKARKWFQWSDWPWNKRLATTAKTTSETHSWMTLSCMALENFSHLAGSPPRRMSPSNCAPLAKCSAALPPFFISRVFQDRGPCPFWTGAPVSRLLCLPCM